MAEHLYIIGNGFDRYHGAKSTYWDFRSYLLRRNDQIVKTFELFFGPKALRNTFDTREDFEACFVFGKHAPAPRSSWATKFLWADFERYLSELDREKVYDFTDMRIPWLDIDSQEFSYADFYAAVEYVADIVELCTTQMQYHFHKWINTLEYEKGHKKKMLDPMVKSLADYALDAPQYHASYLLELERQKMKCMDAYFSHSVTADENGNYPGGRWLRLCIKLLGLLTDSYSIPDDKVLALNTRNIGYPVSNRDLERFKTETDKDMKLCIGKDIYWHKVHRLYCHIREHALHTWWD